MKNHNEFCYYAYLLAWININKFPLTVERISIHSEDPGSITRYKPCLIFTIHSAKGKTYQEAHDQIIKDINSSLLYEKLRPYLHPVIGERLQKEATEHINNLPDIMAIVLGQKE